MRWKSWQTCKESWGRKNTFIQKAEIIRDKFQQERSLTDNLRSGFNEKNYIS